MSDRYPFSVSADEFVGKRVLVTGGTKGIGAAIVRRFQLSGALVATTARSAPSNFDSSTLFVQADTGNAEGVQEVVNKLKSEWNGIDILVHNVGGTEAKPGGFEAMTDEDWEQILNLNLLGAVRLDRAFLPGMLERKSGVIVHISSVSHRLPFSNSTLAYASAKGALIPTARDLLKESPQTVCVSSWSHRASSKHQEHME